MKSVDEPALYGSALATIQKRAKEQRTGKDSVRKAEIAMYVVSKVGILRDSEALHLEELVPGVINIVAEALDASCDEVWRRIRRRELSADTFFKALLTV